MRSYEKLELTVMEIDYESPMLTGSQEFTVTVMDDGIVIEPFTEDTFPDISF